MSSSRKVKGILALNRVSLENEESVDVNDTDIFNDPEVDDPNPTQPETQVVTIPVEEPTVAEQTPEVEIADEQVVSSEEAVEEGLDVLDQINTVHDIVERSNENGGLTPSGAELLNVALESLYDRVDPERDRTVRHVPSVESFGGTGSRIRAGNIALEDIKEQAVKIGKAIINGIVNMAQWFWKYLSAMWDRMQSYSNKFESLEKNLDKITSRAKENRIEDKAVAQAIALGAKPATPKEVIESVKNAQEFGKYISTEYATFSEGLGKRIIDMISDLGREGEVEGVQADISKLAPKTNGIFKVKKGESPTSSNLETPLYIGNVLLAMQVPSTMKEVKKSGIRVVVGNLTAEGSFIIMTKDEMVDLIKEAKALIANVNQTRGNSNKISQTQKQIISSLKSVKEEALKNNEVIRRIADANSVLSSGVSSYVKLADKVLGGALKLAGVSVKHHVKW